MIDIVEQLRPGLGARGLRAIVSQVLPDCVALDAQMMQNIKTRVSPSWSYLLVCIYLSPVEAS
jgi:hypothetical protein